PGASGEDNAGQNVVCALRGCALGSLRLGHTAPVAVRSCRSGRGSRSTARPVRFMRTERGTFAGGNGGTAHSPGSADTGFPRYCRRRTSPVAAGDPPAATGGGKVNENGLARPER